MLSVLSIKSLCCAGLLSRASKTVGEMGMVEKHKFGVRVAASANDPDEGRIAKRRRTTRANLLQAAYEVMSEVGVDAAKIKDITDRADVGFGTFYNYFETKDVLANQVLDALIDDYGRRNIIATRGLRRKDPALVMPVSMRLVMREAARAPMWQWWALRPDILVDRMRDMRDAIRRGLFKINEVEIDSAWALAVWMMVGGVHDIVVGAKPTDSDKFVVNAIMRVMGVPLAEARRISSTALPRYSAPDVDWSFELSESRREEI